MQKFKMIALMLIAVFSLSLCTGCGSTGGGGSASPTPDGSFTVTDMTGREVTIETYAQSIVALTASDCEIVAALGCIDRLVGRGGYCDYPAEVLEIQAVESGNNTNIEEILALAPDVVMMSSMAQTEAQIASLEAAGVTVIVTAAKNIAGTYEAIELIGRVLGKDAEAEALVENMKAKFDALKAKVPVGEERTVYFEVAPLEYGLWASGADTFQDEIAVMLGLRNVFADSSSWIEVSEEQVIERNPDYIVTSSMYLGMGLRPEEEIVTRTGWENITAVREGQVFHTDSDEATRPGPRLVDAAEMLFELIYGS